MSTAEKITLGVAIAGALGLGALLKSWVDHLLARGEKRVTIADKSVQIADALMTRMEAELNRAQAALAKAEQEGEQLRAELGLIDAADEDDSIRVMNAKRKLRSAYFELREARNNIYGIQVEVGEIRERGGLGRGLGELIPPPPITWEELDALRIDAESSIPPPRVVPHEFEPRDITTEELEGLRIDAESPMRRETPGEPEGPDEPEPQPQR